MPSIHTIIRPTKGFRAVNLNELWAYRDLVFLFVWRDFVARYKQTILGPLWYIIQPLIMSFVFTGVFSHVANMPTDDLPPTLFYLCGLLPWNYFSQTFTSTSGTLTANAGLFGKVYFPRLTVPIASVMSNLIAFAIQLLSFFAVYIIYRVTHPNSDLTLHWQAIFLPVVLLQVAALSLGAGLWLTALTAKFRDFTVLTGFLLQIWMYVTPIIYPLAQVPEKWRPYVALNPMAVPVEAFRLLLLGEGSLSPLLIGISTGITLLVLATGVLIFQRVEKTFVDVV